MEFFYKIEVGRFEYPGVKKRPGDLYICQWQVPLRNKDDHRQGKYFKELLANVSVIAIVL